MRCRVICFACEIKTPAQRVVRVAAGWLARRVARAWSKHVARVADNAAYAAATAAVLGALLGLVELREAVAAVLAAVLGLYLNAKRDHGEETRRRIDLWGFA